jgi:hypothetical protein
MWTPGASFSEKGTGLKVEASGAGRGPFSQTVPPEYPADLPTSNLCLPYCVLPTAIRTSGLFRDSPD